MSDNPAQHADYALPPDGTAQPVETYWEELARKYDRLRAALQTIANGEHLPCSQCLEVHEPWSDPNKPKQAPQWSAPDGHYYFQMRVREYAVHVLAHIDGRDDA
jgi:hypothetical protein